MTLYIFGFAFTLAFLLCLSLENGAKHWCLLLLLAVVWPITLGIAAADIYLSVEKEDKQ